MESLSTELLYTTFNPATNTPSFNGNNFAMAVPNSSVSILKPISYEFRVAEHLDAAGNITKVGLQYRVIEHSHQYTGSTTTKRDWTDVERIQIPAPLPTEANVL